MQKRKYFNTLFVFVVVFSLISCGSNQTNDQKSGKDSAIVNKEAQIERSVPDSIVQFLMNSAASDFSNHQPPTVVEFRNLKIGYILSETNVKTFLLCGEFLSAESKNKNQWEPFATLKTEGYEQWVGSGSITYCQKAHFVNENDAALAKSLLENLNKKRSKK